MPASLSLFPEPLLLCFPSGGVRVPGSSRAVAGLVARVSYLRRLDSSTFLSSSL